MAGDTTNTRTWDKADVYVAPTGTTGPTDLTTALNVAFKAVGLLDGDEGFTEGRDQDRADHYAWGGILIKTTKAHHKRTVRFVALEDNLTSSGCSTRLRRPTTAASVDTRTVKTPISNPQAWVFQLQEAGTVKKRRHIPSAEVTDVGDITDSEGNTVAYDITLTVYPAADSTLWKDIVVTPV
jgi:hypothetical protein